MEKNTKKEKPANKKIKDGPKKDEINFKGLNDLFENNLKLYDNFTKGTLGNQNPFKNNLKLYDNFIKGTLGNQKPKENSGKQDFKPQDLYELISPTTDRIFESLNAFSGKIHKDPKLLFENLHIWMEDIVKLNYYFISKASNQKVGPVIKPNISDQRFSSKEWSENLFFDFIKQFYLITTVLLENLVEKGRFEDPSQKDYFKFYISQTKFDNFEIGKNIATTEGKIIYKNNIFELIHYNSDTEKQFEIPLLVIPPFINRYYIMDINKEKSLVKFLVENKINAFLMSWKNPNSDSRDHGFKDYIEDGVLEAIKVACKQSGSPKINLASYCIGGTLLSMTLAYLKNIEEKTESLTHLKNIKIKDRINSATFFASMVNFEDFGDLQMFISEKQISSIEREMKKVGYFDGRNLAATFNFLRPGDLYWNYVVNNYLLGNEPSSFDVLYWNNDSTNLPEKLYSDYLRSLCLNNNLVKNKYMLKGKKLDLSKITTPMFHVATTADHICPWKAVFKGLKYYNSNIKFVLSNSGHVAGIMRGKKSKPGKAFFYSADADNDNIKMTPDKWLKSTTKYEGSWWPAWIKWLAKRSGNLKDAKELNLNKYPAIYNAPGQYVVQK